MVREHRLSVLPSLKIFRRLAALKPVSLCLMQCSPNLLDIGNSFQINMHSLYILGKAVIALTPQ